MFEIVCSLTKLQERLPTRRQQLHPRQSVQMDIHPTQARQTANQMMTTVCPRVLVL